MIAIRNETELDIAPREGLLDAAFGDARFAKTAQRLREGRLPAAGLSFVARANKRLIGTVRLWDIAAVRAVPHCCWARSRWPEAFASGGSAPS